MVQDLIERVMILVARQSIVKLVLNKKNYYA